MEPFRSKKNAFLIAFLLTAAFMYVSKTGLFVHEESAYTKSDHLPIPRAVTKKSKVVMEDLKRLRAMKGRNFKKKDWTNHTVNGITSNMPILKPTFGAFLRHLDYSKYSAEDKDILKNRIETMIERAEVVSEKCQAMHTPDTTRIKAPLVWDTKHRPGIVWCPVYKVASTTWMRNFLRLVHFNEDNPKISKNLPKKERERRRFMSKYGANHNRVFQLYHSPESEADILRVFQESVRVIIVRHPFSRLLSAYRDKMTKEKPRPAHFKFDKLQQEIISKYRSPDSVDNSSFPTFPEFVQHVIDSTEDLETAKDWKDNVNCWVPFWAHCSVCSSDFNIIMKLETMKEDEQFLITLSNLEELKGNENWAHLKGSSSADLAQEYFKGLTQHQIKQLRQRYLLDFELFQYDIDKFLEVALDA